MARDCYSQVFRPTYNQAIADGLAVAVATAAAQSAMDDCLKQHSNVVPTVQPMITTAAGDGAAATPIAIDRSAVLGIRQK